MVKIKAKADRAAARQAAAVAAGHVHPEQLPQASASSSTPQAAPSAQPTEENPAPEAGSSESQPQPEGDDTPPVVPPKESPPDRTEILRSNPIVVERFMRLMVPILIDVYTASVITPVRIKTLTGLLKAVSFLDGDELKRVFTVSVSNSSLMRVSHVFLVVRTCRELCLVHYLIERPSHPRHWCSPARGVVAQQGTYGVQASLQT